MRGSDDKLARRSPRAGRRAPVERGSAPTARSTGRGGDRVRRRSGAPPSGAPAIAATKAAWQPIALEDAADGRLRRRALVAAAVDARAHARARYSGFKVGAALETADGRGRHRLQHRERDLRPDDVRRARRALKALSEGARVFTRIAVVADTDDPDAAVRSVPPAALGVLRRHRRRSSPTSPAVEAARCACRQLLPLPFDAPTARITSR